MQTLLIFIVLSHFLVGMNIEFLQILNFSHQTFIFDQIEFKILIFIVYLKGNRAEHNVSLICRRFCHAYAIGPNLSKTVSKRTFWNRT